MMVLGLRRAGSGRPGETSVFFDANIGFLTLEQVPKKLRDFFDENMLKLIKSERFPIR
jgi:hypothetical protein